jgi:hypothetical protein
MHLRSGVFLSCAAGLVALAAGLGPSVASAQTRASARTQAEVEHRLALHEVVLRGPPAPPALSAAGTQHGGELSPESILGTFAPYDARGDVRSVPTPDEILRPTTREDAQYGALCTYAAGIAQRTISGVSDAWQPGNVVYRFRARRPLQAPPIIVLRRCGLPSRQNVPRPVQEEDRYMNRSDPSNAQSVSTTVLHRRF